MYQSGLVYYSSILDSTCQVLLYSQKSSYILQSILRSSPIQQSTSAVFRYATIEFWGSSSILESTCEDLLYTKVDICVLSLYQSRPSRFSSVLESIEASLYEFFLCIKIDLRGFPLCQSRPHRSTFTLALKSEAALYTRCILLCFPLY